MWAWEQAPEANCDPRQGIRSVETADFPVSRPPEGPLVTGRNDETCRRLRRPAGVKIMLRSAIVRGSMLASFTCEAFSTRRLESLSIEDLDRRLEAFRQTTSW